jgi:shikimate dehydrogenase
MACHRRVAAPSFGDADPRRRRIAMTTYDEVDYVSGRTRVFGIVGHPIEQVRSPEMFTAEFRRRGRDAILVPLHVLPDDFDAVLPQLLRLANLGGVVFTIPYKVRALAFAEVLGAQAQVVGAINALGKGADGRWRAEIFDGLGCVEAFRQRGISFTGKRVMLVGAGGAGSAIAVAVGNERPASLRINDVDAGRATTIAARVARANPGVAVTSGTATTAEIDILLNASPVGMLGDSRLPIELDTLPRELVVFDAVVKPERTPLLALAGACGCTTVQGREMMRGQISRMVDFFLA